MGRQRILAAAIIVALPILIHVLTVTESVRPIGIAVGWLTAAGVAIALARRFRIAALEGGAVAAAVGVALVLSAGTPYAVFVPSVAIDALLLWLFGRTLVPGREPLVSSVARVVRGELPPEIACYTRRATWVWCIFFAALACTSILLAAFAPLAFWSLFANVLVYPLIALMFAAEYLYRRRRFPGTQHLNPIALARRLVQAGYFRPAASTK